MRAYALAILATIFFVIPTLAFSQVGVEIGPGGVYEAEALLVVKTLHNTGVRGVFPSLTVTLGARYFAAIVPVSRF